MSQRPDVSIVIPCYRAAALAREAVAPLRAAFDAAGLSWELIVVDDGGGDFTPTEFAETPGVRLLCLAENRGKGAAVRHGMLTATGRTRLFTDVDVPFGIEPMIEIARRLLSGCADLVIGDRTLPGSDYRLQLTPSRRLASLVFTAFVGSIVTGGLYDTQCGLKGLRGDVVDSLFPKLRIDRFAFDVELLYVALKRQWRIDRLPVRLVRNETSSVQLPRDAVRGAIDLFRIRYHFARGDYDLRGSTS